MAVNNIDIMDIILNIIYEHNHKAIERKSTSCFRTSSCFDELLEIDKENSKLAAEYSNTNLFNVLQERINDFFFYNIIDNTNIFPKLKEEKFENAILILKKMILVFISKSENELISFDEVILAIQQLFDFFNAVTEYWKVKDQG